MDWIQVLGIVAGICTSASLVPQVVKVWKEKEAEDVSLVMLIVLLTGLVLWVVYGFLRKDIPIIATNIFSVLVNVTLIVLRIKYAGAKE